MELQSRRTHERTDHAHRRCPLSQKSQDIKGNEVRGQGEFKKFHHSFRSAFPNIHISIEEMVSEGDLVVGYCKLKATHTGAGFGMESTGKPVAFEGMLMFRVRDRKVVEAWNIFIFEDISADGSGEVGGGG